MAKMQKITPHLWFDKEAREAAAFYTSIFKDSKVKNTTTLHNTPSGSVDIVTIALSGQDFMLISAGPLFTFNPSVSFLVACRTKDEVEALWGKLSEGGSALMELGAYPFSEKWWCVWGRFFILDTLCRTEPRSNASAQKRILNTDPIHPRQRPESLWRCSFPAICLLFRAASLHPVRLSEPPLSPLQCCTPVTHQSQTPVPP